MLIKFLGVFIPSIFGLYSPKLIVMIPTKIHGYLDYTMGVILIIIPFVLNFPEGAATVVPVILGAGVIVYSLFTDYELGAYKKISMKTHIGIDMVAGIILAASPWIFGFADLLFWPFVILGVLEVGAALMTNRVPGYHKAPETVRG